MSCMWGVLTGRLLRRNRMGATALREKCRNCSLRFRPRRAVDPGAAETFYVDEVYKQGFTTDLPSDVELQAMLASRFAGTETGEGDFGYRLEALARQAFAPRLANPGLWLFLWIRKLADALFRHGV